MKRVIKRIYRKIIPRPRATFLNQNKMLSKYEIGEGSWGFLNVLDWNQSTTIKVGRFCSIAEGVTVLLGGDHRTDFVTTYPFYNIFPKAKKFSIYSRSRGDVIIGNDVWIGQNAFILSGVTIGDGAVIGARSVIRRDVPPYAIVAGNPAILTGYKVDKTLIKDLLEIAWWDWPMEKIEEAWPLILSTDIKAFVDKYKKRDDILSYKSD